MPKRTKKEKIIAAYRNKLKLLEQIQIREKPLEAHFIKKEEVKIAEKPVKTSSKTTGTVLGNYFFQDLRKSLFLIVAVVTLEILFYFARIIK